MELSGHHGELPIPMTTSSSSYVAGHPPLHHLHHHPPPPSSNGLTPPPLSTPTTTTDDHHPISTPIPAAAAAAAMTTKKGPAVKYKECLKNHAAAIGGNATDGCGEFMPSGEEGTLEALKCSACHCHRNFHRKEVEGGGSPSSPCGCFAGHPFKVRKGLLISNPDAYSLVPRPPPPHHHHAMIMPLSAMQTSEYSEEMAMAGPPAAMVKKRFRTKFTPEQKEKMLGFAEKVGWRLQRLEDGLVQQFCHEIGVKRRVLKVWMHNNKHNLAKKIPLQLEQ